YLYGKPSLNGDRPPFLMARIVSDGPGRWYVQQHCKPGEPRFVVCRFPERIFDSADEFLWGERSVWQNLHGEEREQIKREEFPFALAVLRTYPRAQISTSLKEGLQQLITFGFEPDASDWTLKEFWTAMPNQRAAYLDSLQAQNDLVFDQQTPVQAWAVFT